MSKLGSSLVLSGTAYFVKTFRTLGLRQFTVEGQDILLDALKEPEQGGAAVHVPRERDKGKGKAVDSPVVGEGESGSGEEVVRKRRGIVTVCNHNSVFDDPLMWSMTPTSSLFPFAFPRHTSRNSRWTLGASDIMFTNPVFSRFFDRGQVIETVRGGGVFQPAIDRAVKLLQDGEWIHIFPEGKVNQHAMNPPGGLFRFKWGVGRIVMDSEVMPEIIPIWISGFDQVMNEYRGFPRPIPRPGGRVSVTIGESISDKIQPLVERWRAIAAQEKGDLGVGGEWRGTDASLTSTGSGSATGREAEEAEDRRQRDVRSRGILAGSKEEAIRIEITAAIQEEVRKLGERVESAEGRFERGEWSQSRRSED